MFFNRKSKIDNPKWVSLFLIVAALTVYVTRGEAQQQAKLPKIGWLDSGPTVQGTRLGELFLRRLHELGYARYIIEKNLSKAVA